MAPVPLYHRIYTVLKDQILDGAYGEAGKIPGETELATQFEASRATIRSALARLERDGMVQRRQGAGTFAVQPKVSQPIRGVISGLVETLLAVGFRTDVQVLEFERERANIQIANLLSIGEGDAVGRIVRVRSNESQPFMYSVTHVPERLLKHLPRRSLQKQPMLQLLGDAGFAPAAINQRIFACAAAANVAPHLGLDIGAPVLGVIRLVRDAKGAPIAHIRALYRPDRYEVELNTSVGSQ